MSARRTLPRADFGHHSEGDVTAAPRRQPQLRQRRRYWQRRRRNCPATRVFLCQRMPKQTVTIQRTATLVLPMEQHSSSPHDGARVLLSRTATSTKQSSADVTFARAFRVDKTAIQIQITRRTFHDTCACHHHAEQCDATRRNTPHTHFS